jgi:hypothetical protein
MSLRAARSASFDDHPLSYDRNQADQGRADIWMTKRWWFVFRLAKASLAHTWKGLTGKVLCGDMIQLGRSTIRGERDGGQLLKLACHHPGRPCRRGYAALGLVKDRRGTNGQQCPEPAFAFAAAGRYVLRQSQPCGKFTVAPKAVRVTDRRGDQRSCTGGCRSSVTPLGPP